jgi:hypothetical protein
VGEGSAVKGCEGSDGAAGQRECGTAEDADQGTRLVGSCERDAIAAGPIRRHGSAERCRGTRRSVIHGGARYAVRCAVVETIRFRGVPPPGTREENPSGL